jgi:hypothetical protein
MAINTKIGVRMRRTYDVDLVINDLRIRKVIIDSHYEKKHSESIDDDIILCLVKTLNGKYEPDDIKGPYHYYVTD